MAETQSSEHDLGEEFRRLGNNLVAAVRVAWNNQEVMDLRQELAGGLKELAAALSEEAGRLDENVSSASAAAQRKQVEDQYLSPSEPHGEEQGRLQAELASALRAANERLQQVAGRGAQATASAGGARMPVPDARQPDRQEVHPDDVQSTPNVETGHVEVHPDDVEAADEPVDLGD